MEWSFGRSESQICDISDSYRDLFGYHGNRCLKPDSVPAPDLPAKFGVPRSINGGGVAEQTNTIKTSIIVWFQTKNITSYTLQTSNPFRPKSNSRIVQENNIPYTKFYKFIEIFWFIHHYITCCDLIASPQMSNCNKGALILSWCRYLFWHCNSPCNFLVIFST